MSDERLIGLLKKWKENLLSGKMSRQDFIHAEKLDMNDAKLFNECVDRGFHLLA